MGYEFDEVAFKPKFGPPYCDNFEYDWEEFFTDEHWAAISSAKRDELGHLLFFGHTCSSDLYFAEFDLTPITAHEAKTACILETLSFWRGSNAIIVLWLNTLVINSHGLIRAYRLDPDSERHAPIFKVFEYWEFNRDGFNHRELYDETELPDGFFDGLEGDDLISDAACNLLGINKIVWSTPVNVREPQKTKLKPQDRQRAYLRKRGLSDLKRVIHTQRVRLHFIQDQAQKLARESDFARKCTPQKLETHPCDHPPDIEPRPKPNQILWKPTSCITTAG